jgi:hypothetical protein
VNLTDLILQVPLAAGALFVVYMYGTGKIHTDAEFQRVVKERDEYKQAAATERRISTEVAQTGNVTNKFLEAIVNLSAERQGLPAPKVIQSKSEDVTKL